MYKYIFIGGVGEEGGGALRGGGDSIADLDPVPSVPFFVGSYPDRMSGSGNADLIKKTKTICT